MNGFKDLVFLQIVVLAYQKVCKDNFYENSQHCSRFLEIYNLNLMIAPRHEKLTYTWWRISLLVVKLVLQAQKELFVLPALASGSLNAEASHHARCPQQKKP